MILILLAIVAIVAMAVYFAGRKAGKGNSWTFRDFGSVRSQTNPSEIPSGWSPDALAKELYDTMNGVGAVGTARSSAWAKLSALTDSQVRQVYMTFNTLPGVSKPDTLTTWIKDEYSWEAPKDQALARLASLNLP